MYTLCAILFIALVLHALLQAGRHFNLIKIEENHDDPFPTRAILVLLIEAAVIETVWKMITRL